MKLSSHKNHTNRFLLVNIANPHDQLEPVVKSEWENLRLHAKFPIVWISIEMTAVYEGKYDGTSSLGLRQDTNIYFQGTNGDN